MITYARYAYAVVAWLFVAALVVQFNRIRAGLGIRLARLKPEEPDPVPLTDAQMAALLAERRPELVAAIGGVGGTTGIEQSGMQHRVTVGNPER